MAWRRIMHAFQKLIASAANLVGKASFIRADFPISRFPDEQEMRDMYRVYADVYIVLYLYYFTTTMSKTPTIVF